MKISRDGPSKNSLGPKLAVVCFSLLAVVAGAQTSDTSNAPAIYCLTQTRIFPDGSTLFFDNSTEENLALFYDEKKSGLTSNAPIIVQSAGTDYATVQSAVDSWIDLRGFVHSVDVLKRQVLFDNWLKKAAAKNSVNLFPVTLTGILDRQTLWASYGQMRYQLDSARDNLRRRCAAASGGGGACDGPPWPDGEMQMIADEIGPASQALDDYKAELETVPMAAPARYDGLCDDARPFGLLFRPPYDDPWKDLLDGSRSGMIFYTGTAPEMSVTESANLQALDPSELTRMASLENNAQDRVQVLADLTQDPN